MLAERARLRRPSFDARSRGRPSSIERWWVEDRERGSMQARNRD